MSQITVRVPASTSNLGAGFDCLGVALRIYNTVTISRSASRDQSRLAIVCEAGDRFFKQARLRPFPFSCSVAEIIPRSRGLGSSATIRVAVLIGLNRIGGNPLERLALFQLAAELEGHPDNAAPAVFGGFTIVVRPQSAADQRRKHSAATVHRFPVSARLRFVLFIPDRKIQTSRARSVLPSKISHAAAAENCANACATTAAFVSKDYAKLRGTFTDRLHQPFRTRLLPFLPHVITAAEGAGALGAFLSGSGSTIAAVTFGSSKEIGQAMGRAANAGGRILITCADNQGARILVTRHPCS
jgi:homoserine kinase